MPGFGTLGVEVPETRPEALEAALDDAANVTFFRIKNSWGTRGVWSEEELRQLGGKVDPSTPKPSYLAAKPGYNDLFTNYLDLAYGGSGHALLQVALPAKLRFAPR
ncbi:MAG: hypothetical protein U0270_23255 [Labilithrix sp.]